MSRSRRYRGHARRLLAVLALAAPAVLAGPALAATQPTVTGPADGSVVTDAAQHVTWTEGDPAGTTSFDVYVSQDTCDTSGSPQITVTSDGTSSGYDADVTLGNGDGAYCVSVVAHDTGGSDPAPGTASVTLDTGPPSPPGNASATSGSDELPSFHWGPGAGDHGGTGIDHYDVYRDGIQIDQVGFGGGAPQDYTDQSPDESGTIHYAVTAVDRIGNESSLAGIDVVYDGPSVQITSHPPAVTNQTTAHFTLSTSIASAALSCMLDGAATNCGGTYAGLHDGPQSFAVQASAGGVSGAAESYSWQVDSTGPTVTITSPSDGALVTTRNVPVAFTGNDTSGTGIDHYECSTGGPFSTCSSGDTQSVSSDGSATVSVRAVDGAGNTGDAATTTFTVDTVAPTTSITAGPADGSVIADSSPTFSFSGSDSPGSGIAGFACSIDGANTVNCASPFTIASLGQGAHSFSVAAVDNAGHQDPSPQHVSFTVDSVAPTVTISSPTDGQALHTRTPVLDFTGSDGGSGIDHFTCSVNGGASQACTSGHTVDLGSDGAHTIVVNAVDNAGNVGSDTAHVTVDTTGPTVNITAPSEGQVLGTASTQIVFTTTETGSGIDHVECAVDGASSNCTSGQTLNLGADGDHTITVTAFDNAGNPGSDSVHVTVDTSAPSTSITGGPGSGDIVSSGSVTFTFNGTDAGSGVASFVCKVDSADFAPCTSPQALTLADGQHTFAVAAIDHAGHQDPTPAQVTFTIDTVAPTVTIGSPASGAIVTTRNVPVGFTGTDGSGSGIDHFECSTGGSFTTCSSGDTLPVSNDGTVTVSVRAVDNAGNQGDPDTTTFTVDTLPPTTTITAGPTDGSVTADHSPTFSFSGTDSPGSGIAGFACSIDGSNTVNCSSPDTIGPLPDGSHTFSVAAVDRAGHQDASAQVVHFTVNSAAPTIDVTSSTRPTNATSVTVTWTATNAVSFTCKLDGGAAAPCSSPKPFSVPGAGQHTVVIQATSPAGLTASQTVSFLVDRTAPTGSFDVPAARLQGTVQLAATNVVDPGGATASGVDYVTYAYQLAGGLTHTAGVAQNPPFSLQWNTNAPGARVPDGTYTLYAIPVDAAGNVGAPVKAPHTTVIDNTGPSTTMNAPAAGTFVRGRSVTVKATVGDPATVAIVQFQIAGANGVYQNLGPQLTGAALTSVSIVWNSLAFDDGAYSLRAVATDGVGNVSGSAPVVVNVDNTTPAAPGQPAAAGSPTNHPPAIAWPASGAGDLASYNVYRGGVLVASQLRTTSFGDTLPAGGAADGAYPYTVVAVDKAGNLSPQSPPVTVVYDTTPPGATAGFSATSDGAGNISLSWPAASDPSAGGVASGLSGYVVRRAAGEVAPASSGAGDLVCQVPAAVTTCSDPGKTIGGKLTYAVFAVDAAGNVSAGRGASVVPGVSDIPGTDKTPPARATKLRASIKGSRAALSWINPKNPDFDHVLVVANSKRRPHSSHDGKTVYRGHATHAAYIGKAGTKVHFAIYSVDHVGNVSAGAFIDVSFPRGPLSPVSGTTVTGAPHLSWHSVKGASYYNVQVMLGKKRVAIAWPHGLSYTVPRAKLVKGRTYTWYVWPGFGRLRDAHYGNLIGKATFLYR